MVSLPTPLRRVHPGLKKGWSHHKFIAGPAGIDKDERAPRMSKTRPSGVLRQDERDAVQMSPPISANDSPPFQAFPERVDAPSFQTFRVSGGPETPGAFMDDDAETRLAARCIFAGRWGRPIRLRLLRVGVMGLVNLSPEHTRIPLSFQVYH